MSLPIVKSIVDSSRFVSFGNSDTLEISSENKDLDNFYGSYVITKNNSMNIVMMNDNSLDDTTPQTYVEVNKVWDDNDNEAGKRPKEIKFGIYDVLNQYELETFVLSEENNWNYSTSFFPCLY